MNSTIKDWFLVIMASIFLAMFAARLAEGGTLKIVKNGRLYANPSFDSRIIGEVKKGMVVEGLAQTYSWNTDGKGDCWYYVELPNGKTGHVQCPLVEEIDQDDNSSRR
jgi:hypothetical protein